MPDHLNPVLLVGAGAMAGEYAKVLTALGRQFVVAGRGAESARRFSERWAVAVGTGSLADQLAALPTVPDEAIVATNASTLEAASRALLSAGVRRLLIEKPAALTPDAVVGLARDVSARGAEAYVAYNRRFYSATEAARRLIDEAGGVLSFKFDFSEASKRIEALDKPREELEAWFYGNSTHVLDLAFFLGGEPVSLHAARKGALGWHPSGAIFTGHGATQSGAEFAYHANWLAPGRWGIEIMTAKHRIVLQPMETVSIQDHASFALNRLEIDDSKDTEFKPGLFLQTQAFLARADDDRLLTLESHARKTVAYSVIRDGGHFDRTER